MAAEVRNFDHDSHSKTTVLWTNKVKNQHTLGGEDLLKAVLKKRTQKRNTMESTAGTELKKIYICTHNLQHQKGEKLYKVLRKGTEKVNINESKGKSKPCKESKKMCFCSPTTHEGSFRCHLHRISAAKKPVTSEKKISLSFNSKQTHGVVEFKPHLSRFSRAASTEVIPHYCLGKQSVVDSA